ncbi:MAG: SDR family oxidoreductase [Cyanobium sp. LacPavin_0920_WC12_MAG_62_9]|nr:SDR family oxidoreductase [Cyanobium sp. LacPavin_0920_WC12_MAG_62_9]
MAAVLITGASRGIGAAAAKAFAAAGFDLLLLSRPTAEGTPSAELEALAASLRQGDRRVEIAGIDLTDPAAIAPGLAELLGRGLVPSVLINNAGAAYTGALAEMPLDQWQWLLQLNVTAVFQVCQAVIPLFRAAGEGLIINVSSHAAHKTFPDWGAYATTKAAKACFSRHLAAEERAHGIRVSTLTLGAVNTPLWDTETVHSDFDRRAMLEVGQVADALLVLAQQPANQVVEDLTLMPAAGAL